MPAAGSAKRCTESVCPSGGGKEPQTIEINLKQDGYVLQITIFV